MTVATLVSYIKRSPKPEFGEPTTHSPHFPRNSQLEWFLQSGWVFHMIQAMDKLNHSDNIIYIHYSLPLSRKTDILCFPHSKFRMSREDYDWSIIPVYASLILFSFYSDKVTNTMYQYIAPGISTIMESKTWDDIYNTNGVSIHHTVIRYTKTPTNWPLSYLIRPSFP